jgi:hypothetical protein
MFSRLASRLKRGYFPNTNYAKNDVPSVYMNFKVGEKDLSVKIKVVFSQTAL